MPSSADVILLTGGSGAVGREWLPLLRCRGRVLALSRQTQAGFLRADLRLPRLGLSTDDYCSLTNTVTDIVHCAADVRFNQSLSHARMANVEGTRHLLDLASACPRLRRFAHLSTVYVAGSREGVFPPEPLPPGHYFNAYTQSKHEAEALVLAAKLPAAVYRLSTIIGNGMTGRVDAFNYFHQIFRLGIANPQAVLPGQAGAPIDLITADWSVRELDRLIFERFEPGMIHHVCAGPEHSLSVDEILALVMEMGGQNRPSPKLVSFGEFERFLKRPLLLQNLRLFLPHLALRQIFLPSTLEDPPPMKPVLQRIVSYCLETDWGRRTNAPLPVAYAED